MKHTLRLAALLLAGVLLLALAGCTTYEEFSEYSTVYIPGEDVNPGVSQSADGTESSSADDNSNKTNNQSGGTTKGGDSKVTTTTRQSGGRKDNNTIRRNITVASGQSKVASYTNTFKGKTYKSLIWTEIANDAYTNELNSFASKYGCTIKQEKVNFESVLTTLSTKLSSGDAYDIVRIQGSWYPRIIISKLLAPLDGSFTTGDCTTDTSSVGIDLEKSKQFAWNDQLYAVTTFDDSPIIYMYFNRQDYKRTIGHDPMELYKSGKWTWEQLKSDAEIAQKQGRSYSDLALGSHHWQLTNGTKLVQEENGKLIVKLTGNNNYINSLKFLRGLAGFGKETGIYAPLDVLEDSGGTDKFDNLMNGKILIWPSESDRYAAAYAQAQKSSYFGNNAANLAICPMPLGPDNKDGSYGGSYLTAFGVGKGSSAEAPQLVAALCYYHSTYEAGNVPKPSADEQAVFNKLYKNVNVMDYGYGTGNDSLNVISHNVTNAIVTGQDITTTLKKYQNTASSYLKSCLNSQ